MNKPSKNDAPDEPSLEIEELLEAPWREFARSVLSGFDGWIASGFGSGFAPIASGTVGSAVALLPWLLLRELPWWAYLGVLVVALGIGIWAAQRVIDRIHVQDPGVIVWDEFIGLWMALFLLPAGPGPFWVWVLAGFLLFRVFDVIKPWPVSWADKHVKGGLGTMLDDLFAGIYAFILLQAAGWYLGR
ncbi:MAG: phosphatidylglycerophosphatase A [Lysobacteraceae bacterium]